MQNREEELKRLYRVLDEGGTENLEDKYVESVRRRLNREYPTESVNVALYQKFRNPLKPKIKILGGIMKKEETVGKDETRREVKEEGVEELEDLFEVEKLSKEELEEILKIGGTKEKERKSIEAKESLSKDKFVELVSKVKGIGKRKAEVLYDSGFNSFDKILKSKPEDIANKVKGLSEDLAVRLKREVSDILPKIEKEFNQMYVLKESEREKKSVEKEIERGEIEFKEELPEWLTIDKAPTDEEPVGWKNIEKKEHYRYEDYTLYKIEKKRGKIKYVFSKKPVKNGEPTTIPKGYIVKVNRKGVPSLEKVK